MTFKKQITSLKDNWLFLVVILLAVFFLPTVQPFTQSLSFQENKMMPSIMGADGAFAEVARDFVGGFAPESDERLVATTTSLTTTVKHGNFIATATQAKTYVTEAQAITLNENTNTYGEGRQAYTTGSYTYRVPTDNVVSFVNNLKTLGDVTSFNENGQDITDQTLDTTTSLKTEQARLQRYNDLYKESTSIEDKLLLNDRIFNQERQITYLKERLTNLGEGVMYSSVYLTIQEEASPYAVVFIHFGDLVKRFVNSVNTLLGFVVMLLPWIILLGIIMYFKRRR